MKNKWVSSLRRSSVWIRYSGQDSGRAATTSITVLLISREGNWEKINEE